MISISHWLNCSLVGALVRVHTHAHTPTHTWCSMPNRYHRLATIHAQINVIVCVKRDSTYRKITDKKRKATAYIEDTAWHRNFIYKFDIQFILTPGWTKFITKHLVINDNERVKKCKHMLFVVMTNSQLIDSHFLSVHVRVILVYHFFSSSLLFSSTPSIAWLGTE